MRNRKKWIVGCVLAITAAAGADQVQLPYQFQDSGGNQWMVYFPGNLQQQGNQPVFSQAGMITVNGQQPQLNNQIGNYDDKAKELTINFIPRNTSLRHSRRFKFDESSTVVRVLDVFENSIDQEAALSVSLTSMTNFGIVDATTITDPKKKTNTLGWMAQTQAERAALSLYAGKGSKVTPSMRNQGRGNNTASAGFQLKVPGKGRVAIVHWHGTFESMEVASQWFDKFGESKALADLPLDLRKDIVNINDTTGGMISGRELLRGGNDDVIDLRSGDLVKGALKIDSYVLNASYGKIKLPASHIAGMLCVGDYRTTQLLITTDGEIFSGTLEQPTLPIVLTSGQTTQVPLAQVARVGYRTNGTEPQPWTFDKPMVFLTGGDRCLIEQPAESLELVTRYGALKISPENIAAVLFTNVGNAYQVYLRDGSRLSGVIPQRSWSLKLTATGADAPVSLPLASLSRVQLSVLNDTVGTGVPTLGLMGDDIVAAPINGEIKLRTAFDTLTLNGREIASITRPQPGLPDWQVTLFDQSSFRGVPELPTLTVELAGGIKLDVPLAAVRDYQNPKPFPSEPVVKRVSDAIAQLNEDDFKKREQAEAQIVTMGASVIGVLEDSAKTQPPEAKERLLSIVKRMRIQSPAQPTRLSPPPAVE